MSALPPDAWRFASLAKARKPDLWEMIDQAEHAGHTLMAVLPTNADRRRWLLGVRAAENDRRHAHGSAPRRAYLCLIPAVEVNAWLRSLPADPGSHP